MSKYDLDEAVKFDPSFRKLDESLSQGSPLRSVVNHYCENLERVSSLATFAGSAFYFHWLKGRASAKAQWTVFQDFNASHVGKSEAEIDAYSEAAIRFFEELNPFDRGITDEAAADEAVTTGHKMFADICDSESKYPTRFIDSVRFGMVVGAWTALEALVEDLWVEALNARPRLALIAINAELTEKDEQKEKERKEGVAFSIPAWRILESDFVLAESMGMLLQDHWNFSRRDEARDAYRQAFRSDVATIDEILTGDELNWLYAMRNAIVHNGAKADKAFIKKVKRHPALSLVRENDQIHCDGKTIADFVSAVVRRGSKLIRFVDKWLCDNPK